MNDKIEKLKETVQKAMGSHCLGVIDQSSLNGQLAFATDEPDRGEGVRGEWMDSLEQAVREAGLERASVMPFPTQDRLIYVVAGLKRAACQDAA